jgi:hypothetical protein
MNTSSKTRAASFLASIVMTLATVSVLAVYAYPVKAPTQLANAAQRV